MQEEIVYAQHKVRTYRSEMDELWVELETATTWEHINEIANRLSETGLAYKAWKRRLNDLTNGDVPAMLGA